MGSKFIYSVATVFIFSIQIFAVSKGGYEIPSDEKTIEPTTYSWGSKGWRRESNIPGDKESSKKSRIRRNKCEYL